MRITLEFDDKTSNPEEPNMLTFHDAEKAVEFLKKTVGTDPNISVILTPEAADDFLGEYYEQIDELSFQLMHEIDLMDDGDPNDDGTLNFTNVQNGDIETIHDSMPCGAEIREFVKQYRHWQLWWR
jgi:hypothetical protein